MFGTRKLGRTSDQRKAMLRAMTTYLLENGKMETCGDGGVRPDFQRQLVIVCHVAYTGVFYGVVHLVDGRIDRIHGDGADAHAGASWSAPPIP